jgi:hypothetical protein
MFAVEAVNNFIPSFVPQLSDHTLGTATAEVEDPSMSSLTAGAALTTTYLDITNNSLGLNRFYRDANGDIQRDPRYFVNVKTIKISSDVSKGGSVTVSGGTGVVAPGKTVKATINGTVPTEGTLYTFTVTYDIFKGELTASGALPTAPDDAEYSNLTATAYLYVTPEKDWQSTVYDGSTYDGVKALKTYEPTAANQSNDYAFSTARGGSSNYLWALFPKSFIVKMSDPTSSSNLGFRVKNEHSSSIFSDNYHAFDGIYTYVTKGTQYYAVNNKTISDTLTTTTADNTDYAYAAIDETTGDVLNYNLYDYRDPETGEWQRGKTMATGVYSGYTSSEISALGDSVTKAEGFMTRPHVAYTLDEALATGYVAGVQRTVASVDDYNNPVYLYQGVIFDLSSNGAKTVVENNVNASTLLLQGNYASDGKYSISWGTPTPGIYLASSKVDIKGGSSEYCKFITYDGSTELSATDYNMNVMVYTTNNTTMYGTVHLYIADDTGASTLQNSYNSNLSTISSYRAEDFSDFDGEESKTYNNMNEALGRAVKAISTPITTANATTLGSTKITVAKTENVTDELNKDIAYVPATDSTNLPASMLVNATKKDGYWYYNEECTIPIYTNVKLTGNNLTKDATGAAVALGDDNEYHLVNAPVYTTEWDTETYSGAPYLADTTEQYVNSNGKKVYKQISFVYRDADGNKVKSTDDWTYKIAESSTVIKPNDSKEYRGLYQLEIDNLAYSLEQLQSKVNTSLGNQIVSDVTLDRIGMNNVNYNVASYEKMVQIAKAAEKLVSDVSYDTVVDEVTGETTYSNISSTTTKSSLQIDAAIKLYEEFKGYVIDRGYKGEKLEKEITCATTPNYNGTTSTPAGYTKNDFTVSDGVVTSATATDAEYGAWVDGTLVNEGETVYSDSSWDAYVSALAEAITVAQEGTAKVSKVYTTKTALQIAENNLTDGSDEEKPSNTITVSGTITIATNVDGTQGTAGIVGINVMVGDTIVATSAEDGSFTAQVPIGTTELTISGSTTVDRTVTLSGTVDVKDVVIPICICDYVKNGVINAYDKTVFNNAFNGEYNVYCDLIPNNVINAYDKTVFNTFLNNTVVYADLSLD